MPTNPHYEAVRAKVIATCPEFTNFRIDNDIHLSHILRTLASQRQKIFNFGQSWRSDNEFIIGLLDSPYEAEWRLEKDNFSSQSPETWEALDKMLGV